MSEAEAAKQLRSKGDFKFHLIQHIVAWSVFVGVLCVNYWTGNYVDKFVENLPPAHDLVFEYLPSLDLSLIHFWGFVTFLVLAFYAGLRLEGWENVPYALWTFSVLIFVRAIFTTLTPLGLPHDAPVYHQHGVYNYFLKYFDFRGTMFFSGHTSFPFMGFLIYRTPWVKKLCLALSIILACEVLISRLHYSIDVAAAYFIAYGVYRAVGFIFFRVEYQILRYAYKVPETQTATH